jgi:predicted small secreted protein
MRGFSILAVLVLLLTSLAACNTARGIGKDFEELGRALGL